MKLIQPDIPVAYEILWAKIMRWFERNGVPIWCAQWFQTSRSVESGKKQSTKIPSSAAAWKLLDAPTKLLWKSAAYKATGFYRAYRMFCSDFIYRRQNGLSLPGTPSDYHQLFGLEMANPGASQDVEARIDDKDLIGPISYKLSYKKIENTPSATYGFIIKCRAYYFTPGSYAYEDDEFTAPSGNVGWNTINRSFGTAARPYFHFKITISIKNYDAVVQIDNFKLSDNIVTMRAENWNVAKYAPWTPTQLYRKKDWQFTPSYSSPYFVHKYLE